MYDTLLSELRSEEFLRMAPENFDEILNLIRFDIKKEDTVMRNSIPPRIKFTHFLISHKNIRKKIA